MLGFFIGRRSGRPSEMRAREDVRVYANIIGVNGVASAVPPEPSSTSLVAEIRRRSGLSQAELARRAGVPRSVINAYVRGQRQPRVDTVARIAAAAGLELRLVPRTAPVDAERASRRLVQVLELAEALPFRGRERLGFPPLPAPLRARSAGR